MATVSYVTEATPGRVNEDFVVAGPDWAVVLDGATAPSGLDSGCIHDVAWLVRNLAGAITSRLVTSNEPLESILSSAIEDVCSRHADTCDLTNPSSPSSTVAIVRFSGNVLEYLSLADSPIVVEDQAGKATCYVDEATTRLPSYTPEALRESRNTDGGFWVASTCPDAAYHALSGSVQLDDVKRVAILSDGGARYVERFGLGEWTDLLDILEYEGPGELIRRVRTAEAAETDDERKRYKRRGKQHDDATAVLLSLGTPIVWRRGPTTTV